MSVVSVWSTLRGHRHLKVTGVLTSYLDDLQRMKEEVVLSVPQNNT